MSLEVLHAGPANAEATGEVQLKLFNLRGKVRGQGDDTLDHARTPAKYKPLRPPPPGRTGRKKEDGGFARAEELGAEALASVSMVQPRKSRYSRRICGCSRFLKAAATSGRCH